MRVVLEILGSVVLLVVMYFGARAALTAFIVRGSFKGNEKPKQKRK